MSHTPTPWPTLNVPPINRRFHAKLGPLLISRGSDEDILFAQKAVNSHDRLVEALRDLSATVTKFRTDGEIDMAELNRANRAAVEALEGL